MFMNSKHSRISRAKRIFIYTLTLILMTPVLSGSVSNQQFLPYIEKFKNGWIDWDNGLIYGIGKGYLHNNGNIKSLAMRAANLIAYGSVLKLAAGVNLDDQNMVKSLGSGEVTIMLKALVKAREHSTKFEDKAGQPYIEVVKVTSLKGIDGLSSKLMKHLQSTPWRKLPQRTKENKLDDQDEPWLILDARELGLSSTVVPALFPKIVTPSGETIHSIDNAEEHAVVERGMARYVVTSNPLSLLEPHSSLLSKIEDFISVQEAIAAEEEPFTFSGAKKTTKRKRRGKRKKFIVKKVENVQGLAKTNLVISEADALQLKNEDSSSKILKKCRVVVVVASQLGGIEGMLRKMRTYALLLD